MNAVNPLTQSENSVEGFWTGNQEKNPLMTQMTDPASSLDIIVCLEMVNTYSEDDRDIVGHIPYWTSQNHLRNPT
jgi:hypothetical protein